MAEVETGRLDAYDARVKAAQGVAVEATSQVGQTNITYQIRPHVFTQHDISSSHLKSSHLKKQNQWEAARSKEVFAKHVDSVLSKCAKIRSLITDLQKNYTDDPTAKKFLD